MKVVRLLKADLKLCTEMVRYFRSDSVQAPNALLQKRDQTSTRTESLLVENSNNKKEESPYTSTSKIPRATSVTTKHAVKFAAKALTRGPILTKNWLFPYAGAHNTGRIELIPNLLRLILDTTTTVRAVSTKE